MTKDLFTEAEYRKLLELTKEQYRFCGYCEEISVPKVVLRHDLDTSVHRALAIAEIEAELDVFSTYFLFPRSLYYNILNPEIKNLVTRILAMGHKMALHFDVSMDYELANLHTLLLHEKGIIENEFAAPAEAVSFHLAGNFPSRLPKETIVAGMVNAYSVEMQQRYKYVSDSNGVWRFDRWEELIDASKYPSLHILIHPEWWTPQQMTPRKRLQRAIDGYAHEMGNWYDELTKSSGRPNY
jgi:hypothetical protein